MLKQLPRLYQEAQARAPAKRARAKEEMARAIEEAQKRDDAAFGHCVKPNSVAPSHGEVPLQADLSAAPDSVPSSNSNPIQMIVTFFHNHRFWAVPVQNTRTILVASWKWASCLCCGSRPLSEENVSKEAKRDERRGVATEQPRVNGML